MKRFLNLFIAVVLAFAAACPPVCAEEHVEKAFKAPSKFLNIGFAHTTMKQGNSPDISSDLGFSLTSAKTYYLHKPIAGRLRFGIEAAWTHLNYSNYKVNYISMLDPERNESVTIHAAEITIQAGLGINFNICRHSSLHAYFRYAPGVSMMYDSDTFNGGFLNSATGGLLINYRKIGLGVDWRFGTARHKNILGDFTDQDDDSANEKVKVKFNGIRAYIALVF